MAVPEAQFDEILASDPLPVAMWSYTSSQYSTPDVYLFDSALSDGRYGAVNSFVDGYSDPAAIDALINSARTTLDEAERLSILSEIQRCPFRGGHVDHACQRGRSVRSRRVGAGSRREPDVGSSRPSTGRYTASEVARFQDAGSCTRGLAVHLTAFDGGDPVPFRTQWAGGPRPSAPNGRGACSAALAGGR